MTNDSDMCEASSQREEYPFMNSMRSEHPLTLSADLQRFLTQSAIDSNSTDDHDADLVVRHLLLILKFMSIAVSKSCFYSIQD